MTSLIISVMKKKLVNLTLFLCLVGTAYTLADEVTIVSDRWYPYNGIPKSPTPGFGIEIARYGLEKAGHSLKYQLMSFERSVEQVRQGKKKCVIGVDKSETLHLKTS